MAKKVRPKKKRPRSKREEAPEEPSVEEEESGGGDSEPERPRRPAAPPVAAPERAESFWTGRNILIGVLMLVALAAALKITQDNESGDGFTDIDLDAAPSPPEELVVHVVARHAHQRDAFTQGLLWHNGFLYESTGLRGRSSLRRVDLETGEVLQRRSNADEIFAEGLARVGEELVQLTWEEEEAHVWDVRSFEHVRTMEYQGEGWGLCYDGTHLVMSDGSSQLTFRDPTSFRIRRTVRVRHTGRPVDDLNELECVDGVVWANVWHSDHIYRIDPESGRVTGDVDASGLLTADDDWDTDVLNGIAWLPERERFAITGKQWPWLFEVRFVTEEERARLRAEEAAAEEAEEARVEPASDMPNEAQRAAQLEAEDEARAEAVAEAQAEAELVADEEEEAEAVLEPEE